MTDIVDDFLAHYGVKGMKWGSRKARKADRDAAILKARENQKKRKNEFAKAQADLTLSFEKNESKGRVGPDSKFEKAYFQKKMAYLNNPDVKTARQKTSGEKMVDRLIITAGTTAIAALVTAGTLYDLKKSS